MTRPKLNKAYQHCQKIAHNHYENFPVASLLLPKQLRQPISVIYAFARTADDIADEGKVNQQQRLTLLTEFEQNLTLIRQKYYCGDDPIFLALDDVIHQFGLPVSLFEDLLSAFKQDISQNRYQSHHDLLDYCRRSANPIGRLLLHLNGQPSPLQLTQSDAICTALQLINFYQDIQQDWQKNNRVYLPMTELKQAELTEHDLNTTDSSRFSSIIRAQYQKAQALLTEGYEMANKLPGRLGWEIRTITLTGIVTLKQLSAQQDNSLYSRPRLSKRHTFIQAMLAYSPIIYSRYCKYSLKQIVELNTSA